MVVSLVLVAVGYALLQPMMGKVAKLQQATCANISACKLDMAKVGQTKVEQLKVEPHEFCLDDLQATESAQEGAGAVHQTMGPT